MTAIGEELSASKPYELYSLDVDFIVKHPFELDEADPDFPVEYYQRELEKLFARRKVLSATDWSKSSNAKSFRPANASDTEAIRRSVAATRSLIHSALLPQLFGLDTDYWILAETVVDIRFGCVSGRISLLIAAAGVIATLGSGIVGAKATTYFERPNHSTNCSIHVSTPQAVAHHLKTELTRKNDQLFDAANTSCVLLRQKLLAAVDAYEGRADGRYDDKTAQAELHFAQAHGLNSEDLENLYTKIAQMILEPPITRHRRR